MPISDSSWITITARQLTNAINQALAMAPAAQKHLKNLEHCVLKLHLKGLNSTLYFAVERETNTGQTETARYRVFLSEPKDKPDVFLSGSLLNFLKLASQKNKASLFRTKQLELEGDAIRIQQILAFINALEIDWDGALANVIGDVPAHFISTLLRSGISWGLNLSQSFFRDAEEYIKFELRLFPDKARAKLQFSKIASLSNELETLQTRIDALEKKLC